MMVNKDYIEELISNYLGRSLSIQIDQDTDWYGTRSIRVDLYLEGRRISYDSVIIEKGDQ